MNRFFPFIMLIMFAWTGCARMQFPIFQKSPTNAIAATPASLPNQPFLVIQAKTPFEAGTPQSTPTSGKSMPVTVEASKRISVANASSGLRPANSSNQHTTAHVTPIPMAPVANTNVNSYPDRTFAFVLLAGMLVAFGIYYLFETRLEPLQGLHGLVDRHLRPRQTFHGDAPDIVVEHDGQLFRFRTDAAGQILPVEGEQP